MDTPVRKYQKQKDYQRHKLFRKMKRRRRAAIEQAKDAPMKPLRRKFKMPKFEGGKDESTQKMNRPNIYRYSDGRYVYQAAPDAEEIEVSPINTLLPNPSQWTYQDASGKIYTPHAAQVDTGSIIQDEERNPLVRAANNYFREAAYRAKDGTLALQGKYTMPAIAASALLPLAGEAAYPLLTNPYVDAGLTSAFAAHGLNHAINEGIDGWGDAAMTALEVVPLGRLVKPMWNAAKSIRNFIPTSESNMSGVRYAYDRNSELANIGTLEDYNDYLKTVFPESKVKDINYHMGPKGLQELKPSTGEVYNTNPDARGIYVTPDKSYAQKLRKYTTSRLENPSFFTYIKRNLTPGGWDKANEAFTDIYPVMVDTKNPLLTKGDWTWGIKDKKYQSLMDDYDAIVNSGPKWYQNFNSMPETIVPKTEQSLILGSDADVAGFRRFMSNPQITAENAASITPEQWTAAQDAAIARGDTAEAQRLRDLHFKVSAPTPYISKGVYLPSGSQPTLSQADYYNGNSDLVTLYHSSVDADNLIKEGFDGVEHGLGRTKGEAKGTIFASANPDYAADYSNLYIQEGLSTPDKVGLVELKVPRGAGAFEGNEVRLRPEHIKEITKSAYEKTPWLRWLKTRKTNNNLFNIKSADAVTFDNNGVRIPLGKRDNFNINDIRYGLLAPLAGGTALLGYNSLGQPIDTYKHGKDSGIHINPKNRGKFNALKKRTGKTTEQLTHSKNPLTRKRAIFAQNAKKWKH